jgi:hypothetical protein
VASPAVLTSPALLTGRDRLIKAVAILLTGGMWGAVIAGDPLFLRLLTAATITFALWACITWRRSVGIFASLGVLIVLALLRRILIPYAGWQSFDPLVLVGPAVVFLLVAQLFVLERRRLGGDRLSNLVLLLLAIELVQSANPRGGGIFAGLGGLLFVGVPLLWFFVGREAMTRDLIRRLTAMFVLAGTGVALYGLAQTQIGFLSWDSQWIDVAGYSSIRVGDSIRAFGTFSSNAEYALFIGSAAAMCVALTVEGRTWAIACLPVLLVALFFSSIRSATITALLACVLILALVPRRPALAVALVLVGIVVAFGAVRVVSSGLQTSSNDLVSRQVGGLSDPLNPENSTLLLHVDLVIEGMKLGFRDPIGLGTGSTNQAGSKLSGGKGKGLPTEIDISNAFVGLGLLGGLTYLALVISIFTTTIRQHFAGRPDMLPVVAVLVVGLGQWLTGGHYALSPITWLLIGFVAAGSGPLRRYPT